MSGVRNFKPLGNVEPTDAELEAFATSRGIPTISTVQNESKRGNQSFSRTKDSGTTSRLAMEFPTYLIDQLKRRALDQRSTVRFVILQALHKDGFDIDEQDLIPDGRRLR